MTFTMVKLNIVFGRRVEVKVCLRCLNCATFITSPSFGVIKKHFEKCQLRKCGNIFAGIHLSDNDDYLFNMTFDDFIDDEIETVTIRQPSLVLKKCDLEHSNFKTQNFEQRIQVEDVDKQLKNEIGRKPRKSHLEATEKLSKLMKHESGNESVSVNADKDYKFEYQHNLKDKRGSVTNSKVGFNCDLCSAWFRKKLLLQKHVRSVHISKTGDVFTCQICNKMIKSNNSFHCHLNLHEKAEASEKQFNLWKQWPKQSKSSQVNFKCKYCLMTQTNHSDFLSHMATDHCDKGEHYIFQCWYNCSTQLDSISKLISHFRSAHLKEYCGFQLNSDEFIVNKRGDQLQKCDQCGKFYHLWYIEEHKKRLHSNVHVEQKGTLICAYPNCELKLKNIDLLRRHFILHLENNPYVCNFPGCKFKSRAPCRVMEHMKEKHFNEPPICAKCGVTYSCKDVIKTHHCEDNIKKLKSGNYKLEQTKGFWKLKKVQRKEESKPVKLPENPKLNKCDPKDEVDEYIESLKRININAVIRSDPGFIQACKNSPGFGQLLLGNDYNCEKFGLFKRFKCSNCGTIFGGQYGYAKHKTLCESRASADNTQVKIGCEICGNSFESEQLLEQHVNEEHSPGEAFKCDAPSCGRYFRTARDKQEHFYRMHGSYRCKKCNSNFESQTDLDDHLEEHRSNPSLGASKTSECKVCGKVLASLQNRRNHMRTKHGITVPVVVKRLQSKSKKKGNRGKKRIRTRRNQRERKDFAEFPLNVEKTVVQIKSEPELTILPDVIKNEVPDFGNYEQIGKQETDDVHDDLQDLSAREIGPEF